MSNKVKGYSLTILLLLKRSIKYYHNNLNTYLLNLINDALFVL